MKRYFGETSPVSVCLSNRRALRDSTASCHRSVQYRTLVFGRRISTLIGIIFSCIAFSYVFHSFENLIISPTPKPPEIWFRMRALSRVDARFTRILSSSYVSGGNSKSSGMLSDSRDIDSDNSGSFMYDL